MPNFNWGLGLGLGSVDPTRGGPIPPHGESTRITSLHDVRITSDGSTRVTVD